LIIHPLHPPQQIYLSYARVYHVYHNLGFTFEECAQYQSPTLLQILYQLPMTQVTAATFAFLALNSVTNTVAEVF